MPDASIDAGPTRPYALASTGAQLLLTPQPGIYLGAANLAADVDVVLIHQDFYGVPWTEFEAGTAPPAAWVFVMDTLAAHASSVGPVALSLQLVSGDGRRFLADRTVVTSGTITTQKAWSAQCYDFSTAADGAAKRAAYLAYVDYMVAKFQPHWVNVAIEINMFSVRPASAWNALVDVERAAYDRVKAASPTAIVYPSISLEYLYGYATCAGDLTTCYDANYTQLANLKRDRFAVTTFPYLLPEMRDQTAIPADWFTRPGDRGGEQTIVAETGWLGTPLVAKTTSCVTGIESSEALQLAWFDKLMASADRMDLVTWVSNRDVMPAELMTDCPCDYDATWCGFLDAFRQSVGSDPNAQAGAEYGLKQFGSMGLRHHDGTLRTEARRALAGRARAAVARHLAPSARTPDSGAGSRARSHERRDRGLVARGDLLEALEAPRLRTRAVVDCRRGLLVERVELACRAHAPYQCNGHSGGRVAELRRITRPDLSQRCTAVQPE